MPGEVGVGPSKGLIARLLAIIMGGEGDKLGGLKPRTQGDIYLPPEGPSMQERMDALMRPRTDAPMMPSLGPSNVPSAMRPAPMAPNPEMEQVERLRKRNEMLGKFAR